MQGGATVLILLLMLTLLSFGLLALLSAHADLILAGKNADRARSYYELDARAQTALGELDGILAERPSAPGERAATLGWAADPNQPLVVSQTFPGEKTALTVSLRLTPDARPNRPRYEIVAWREIPAAFDYDVGQDLWVPE
jgi:hypothetical protein